MRLRALTGVALLAPTTILLACGGGAATVPDREPEPIAAAPEPAPAPEPEPEPEPLPEPEPITAEDADGVKEVLFAAATDIHALSRIIDPEWGIGVFGTEEIGMRHYCDMAGLASHPGVGFLIGTDDQFRCDRGLDRCLVRDEDGRGFVFHFRDAEGGGKWLSAIATYEGRVPNSDNARARAFVRAGDGVCALRRALLAEDAAPPEILSVFVASHTGLVPETLAEHYCGDEAAQAYQQYIGAHTRDEPDRCDRDPTRCQYKSGDELYTIYGDADGPSYVTVTRPGMHTRLAREQQREVDAFTRSIRRRECADETAEDE